MSDLEDYFEIHVRPPEIIPCMLSPPLSWQGSDCGYSIKQGKTMKQRSENSLEY